MTSSNRRSSQTITQVLVLLAFAIGLVVIFFALGVFNKREPKMNRITFRIDGTASVAVINYTRPEGGVNKIPQQVSLPWEASDEYPKGTLAIITAGNPTQSGTLRCTILLNGSAWKRQEVNAPQDKVSCAGMVP